MSKKISELTAATTPLAGTELVEIVQSGTSVKVAASYLSLAGGGRELLSAARAYYVRSDGSDSNDGLTNTSGGAFLTIKKAVDVTCSLDMSIYQVTINCGDATRTENVSLKRYFGALSPSIVGNTTTPANCLMSSTSGNCFTNRSGVEWIISGFKFTTTTSGYGISVNGGGSRVNFSSVEFGICASSHLVIELNGVISATGNYSISGAANAHVERFDGGLYIGEGRTLTITGTPNFPNGFLYGRRGHARIASMTFSGSATGPRFADVLNSTIYSGGATEATYIPGNSSGTRTTGSEWA